MNELHWNVITVLCYSLLSRVVAALVKREQEKIYIQEVEYFLKSFSSWIIVKWKNKTFRQLYYFFLQLCRRLLPSYSMYTIKGKNDEGKHK